MHHLIAAFMFIFAEYKERAPTGVKFDNWPFFNVQPVN